MPIYKPSELKAFLAAYQVRPNKKLSQNFLVDANVLEKIVAKAAVIRSDVILEIGAGPGALTEKLLACGCEVIALEKDPILAHALERFSSDKLTVICADALEVDCQVLLQNRCTNQRKAKVVANLPYHITSKLLEKLVLLSDFISSCTVMVQKDAAIRFIEKKGAKSFGFFSLFLQYHAKLSVACSVSPKSFYPQPRVGSSVLQLILQKQYPVCNEARFFSLLETAFCHRRKMLTASLEKELPREALEKALISINKKKTTRPEELTLSEWVQLYKIVGEYRCL